MLPGESQVYVRAHGLCKRGTTMIFDMIIINLDAGSCLNIMTENVHENLEKENKDKCLQACMDHRRNFTDHRCNFNPMV